MLPCGGMDAGWKLARRNVDENQSLPSDNVAASSSENKSTTAGCREVTCMRRAYAISLQIRVASVFHPFKPFFNTWVRGVPLPSGGVRCTIRVISSGLKVAKGARSSSRVSPWNFAVNCSNTPFVAGQ